MPRRALLLPVLVATIASLVVLSVWLAVRRQEEQSIARQMDLSAVEGARRLEDFIASRLTVVQTIREERAAGLITEEQTFLTRALIAQEEFGGFQAINWIGPDGTILWVAPARGNLLAQGRNLRDHPQAAPFYEEALSTREPTVTGPIDLFQGKKGFASYFPVFIDQELVGVVNGVFDIQELVQLCLGNGELQGLEVRVIDDTPVIYESAGFDVASDRVTASAALAIRDRTWDVTVAPRAELWQELQTGPHEGLLAIGLLLSLGLGWLLHLAMKREAVQQELEREREQLAELVEASVDLIGMARPDGTLFYFNEAARRLLSIESNADFAGLRIVDFIDDSNRDRAMEVQEKLLEDGYWEGELRYKNLRTGEPIDMEVRAFVIHHPRTGEVTAIAASGKDLREKNRLEAELRQAQKMEAVGRLAGGVAHDFNNLLTAMIGHAEMAHKRLDGNGRVGEHVDEILKASRRAADLTAKLLAFSRKQVIEPRAISLSAQLDELVPLLRRLVPEDVELRVDHRGACVVLADPAQMEQVVMNLAINAADAMPEGGELRIRASEDQAEVVLEVSDTGVGMGPEVRERVFEPFFTTKPVGRGTGLGLATVYGIVTQAQGRIEVHSEEGKGTTFEVRLPRTDRPPTHQSTSSGDIPAGGRESVLLVEDEGQVRDMSVRALTEAGYDVIEASNGEEALHLLEGPPPGPDLLISDLVMPRMGGLELAERLRDKHPSTRLLLTSGHPDERVDSRRLRQLGASFLPKPYTTRRLLELVRRVLDE